MHIKYWLAGLVFLPFAAVGQEAARTADPADASAVVPPVRYESPLKNYQPSPAEEMTPDQVWRSINDTVKDLGGHSGHLQASRNAALPAEPGHGKLR